MYENNVPVSVLYPEGRVVLNSSGTAYCNEAYIKDHLGNVRVACYNVGSTIKIRQVNSYYPFGMNIKELSANSTDNIKRNEYLYNGKMFQDEMGLNLLDYGARFYDAVLGRWHAIDPFAEVYNAITPYHYAANNPIKNIDVKGKLLKDKDGNIIATSNGNIVTREIVREGKVVGSVTYQEVTVYTDKKTSIIALEMIAKFVVNEDENNDIGVETNCHGWALGGGGLYILDDKGSIFTILKDDGYKQTDNPAEAAIFIEAFAKTDQNGKDVRTDKDTYHTGTHDKVNDTYSADHGDGKPTENGTLESASSDGKGTKGIKTLFFKEKTSDQLNRANIKLYGSDQEAKDAAVFEIIHPND